MAISNLIATAILITTAATLHSKGITDIPLLIPGCASADRECRGAVMPADVIDQELDAVRAVHAPVERRVGVSLAGCEDRHVLRYPNQATFHPLKYLAGVVEAPLSPEILTGRFRTSLH